MESSAYPQYMNSLLPNDVKKAQLAIVKVIEDLADGPEAAAYASTMKDLAEAYAWLARPDASHGGSTAVKIG